MGPKKAELTEEEDQLRKHINGCRYCLTCQKVYPSGYAHKKRSGGHELRSLTPEEKEAEKVCWRDRLARGDEAKKEQVSQDREVHAAAWKEPEEPTRPVVGSELLTFGKYKGKMTLEGVLSKDRGYLVFCVMVKNPQVISFLQKKGILAQLQVEAEALRQSKAQKVLVEPTDRKLHPEIQKLKRQQREWALGVTQGAETDVLAVQKEATQEQSIDKANTNLVPSKRPAHRPRKRKSKAVLQLKRCLRCGAIDHNSKTCPHVQKTDRDTQLSETETLLQKQKRKAQALSRTQQHLKYSSLHQRIGDDGQQAGKKARAWVSRSFLEMARASPWGLTRMLQADALLCELQDVKCPNPRCAEGKGFGSNGVLGKLVGTTCMEHQISKRSVHYRCDRCRVVIMVNEGSGLFPARAVGMQGSTTAALVYRNAVIGISITHTAIQLDASEDVVRPHYHRALKIMGDDAIERQSKIVYGRRGNLTTDVEVDEHSFVKWKEDAVDPVLYYWYPWVGVVERGNLATLSLYPMGVTKSTGEPRIPPISKEFWTPLANSLFPQGANIVQMSDGAQTYLAVTPPGVVDKYSVCHEEHE